MSTRRTKIVRVIGRLLLFGCVLLFCTMVIVELLGAGVFEQLLLRYGIPWNAKGFYVFLSIFAVMSIVVCEFLDKLTR